MASSYLQIHRLRHLSQIPAFNIRSVSTSIRSSSASILRSAWPGMFAGWQKKYETYVHLPELRHAHAKVIQEERKYMSHREDRDQCWFQLLNAYSQMKDIHAQLDPMSTLDRRFSQLLFDETMTLKRIRSLTLDFHLYDEIEQTRMSALSLALRECLQAEQMNEKLTQKFWLMTTLIGLMLGILATYISIYLHSYLTNNREKSEYSLNDLELRHLTQELVVWLQNQNGHITIFLKDLMQIFGLKNSLSNKSDASMTLLYEDDKFVEIAKQFVPIFDARNAEVLQLMNYLRDIVAANKKVCNLEITPEEQKHTMENKEKETNDKPLWYMTLAYGSVAVVLPILCMAFS